MHGEAQQGVDWVHLPVIATVARLLCRELTLQNEYLLLENRTPKSRVPGRLRFTDEERRSLAEAALAMGRSLMKEVVSIVRPETVLAWQRRLVRRKWDYSQRRRRGSPDGLLDSTGSELDADHLHNRTRPQEHGTRSPHPFRDADARLRRAHFITAEQSADRWRWA